jgi:hypothetical protein
VKTHVFSCAKKLARDVEANGSKRWTGGFPRVQLGNQLSYQVAVEVLDNAEIIVEVSRCRGVEMIDDGGGPSLRDRAEPRDEPCSVGAARAGERPR